MSTKTITTINKRSASLFATALALLCAGLVLLLKHAWVYSLPVFYVAGGMVRFLLRGGMRLTVEQEQFLQNLLLDNPSRLTDEEAALVKRLTDLNNN